MFEYSKSINRSLLLRDLLVWKSKTYVIHKINQWGWRGGKWILF